MLLIINEIKLILKYRELLWQLTGREIKARYKQSFLGYFWVIFNPLAQMIVMSYAFSIILKVPTNATSNIPYSIFLFTALLPWNLFANSLTSASNTLVVNSGLLTKIYFPRTILPISTILAKIVDFLFASLIYIIYMLWYQIPINFNVLWIIPIFFIQLIFTTGLSLFLSATNLLYRDIQYLLGLILTLWIYVTPVFYPADLIPPQAKLIFQFNPMAVIINAYRQVILAAAPPNISSLWIAFVVSITTLMLALTYFKQQEKTFADNV